MVLSIPMLATAAIVVDVDRLLALIVLGAATETGSLGRGDVCCVERMTVRFAGLVARAE